MSVTKRKLLILKGRKELSNGIFPYKIIESIKEERLRKDVTRHILTPPEIKLEDLSDKEKENTI